MDNASNVKRREHRHVEISRAALRQTGQHVQVGKTGAGQEKFLDAVVQALRWSVPCQGPRSVHRRSATQPLLVLAVLSLSAPSSTRVMRGTAAPAGSSSANRVAKS